MTFPTIILTISLIIVILLAKKYKFDNISVYIYGIIAFGAGYALTWLAKWGLAYFILDGSGYSLFSAHADDIIRIGDFNIMDRLKTIPEILDFIFGNLKWGYWTLIIGSLIIGFLLFKKKKNILPFLICILIPMVWYTVISNHTRNHVFMTYRTIVPTVYAAISLLILQLGNLKISFVDGKTEEIKIEEKINKK
jgi:hypothetical protein